VKQPILTASLIVASCALDDFEKLTEFCGMPPSTSAECIACITASPCCELTAACAADGSCGGDLGKPVTPASAFPAAYDPVLGCLQEHCDAPCAISWGCENSYAFETPPATVRSSLMLLDSSEEFGAGGLEAHGCAGTDPLCLDGVPLGMSQPDTAIPLGIEATFADFYRFTQPGSDPADPSSYVPVHTRWSEPVTWVGPASTYVFKRRQVQALVTVSQSAEAYDPMQSHLVFFAHNCLPMRYAFQGMPPFAQAEGVTVRLEPEAGAYPIVYTSSEAFPDRTLTKTSTVGSGGVVGIPSERNLTVIGLRDGREFSRTIINAPKAGLGIVHLVPSQLR
jgi:hypothetical protein